MKTTKEQRDGWRTNGKPMPYAMLLLLDDVDEAEQVIPAFAAGLKAHLRKRKELWFQHTTDGEYGWDFIDWDELDKAIDAFAAEFKKGKR